MRRLLAAVFAISAIFTVTNVHAGSTPDYGIRGQAGGRAAMRSAVNGYDCSFPCFNS
jgi:hypothetical protein